MIRDNQEIEVGQKQSIQTDQRSETGIGRPVLCSQDAGGWVPVIVHSYFRTKLLQL